MFFPSTLEEVHPPTRTGPKLGLLGGAGSVANSLASEVAEAGLYSRWGCLEGDSPDLSCRTKISLTTESIQSAFSFQGRASEWAMELQAYAEGLWLRDSVSLRVGQELGNMWWVGIDPMLSLSAGLVGDLSRRAAPEGLWVNGQWQLYGSHSIRRLIPVRAWWGFVILLVNSLLEVAQKLPQSHFLYLCTGHMHPQRPLSLGRVMCGKGLSGQVSGIIPLWPLSLPHPPRRVRKMMVTIPSQE